MSNTVKALAAVLFLGVIGAASDASATDMAGCTKYADGSGYCYGNFRGWKAIGANGSYAQFSANDYGGRSFYARYAPSGTTTLSTYSCSPNAALLEMWDLAMTHQGYFYLAWNTIGTCDYFYVVTGSHYNNF